jgi:peptide/nickel transport system substrate-binding protein
VRDGNTAKVSRLVYRGLYRVRGSDLQAEEDLAESLHYEHDLRACIQLKDDLRFHDGRTLRAGDVAFTIRSAMDPDTGAAAGGLYRDRFTGLDLPEGPNGRSICFDLRAPVATLKTDLVFGILPRDTVLNPRRDPPGTGAYTVFRRDGDRGLVLKRNQPQPKAPDYLVIRTLPDENSRLLAILSGDADLVLNGFSPSVIEILEERPEVATQDHASVTITYLTMNTTQGPLTKAEIRHALALSIDRDWIVENRFGGRADVANGMLPKGHWARDDTVLAIPYSPKRAGELLDKAGYPLKGDGTRFELELLTSNDRLRRLVARDLARFWKAVGISVRVRSLEIGTLLHAIRRVQYQMAILQLPEAIEPDMMRWMFHSLTTPVPEIRSAESPWGKQVRMFLEPGLMSLVFRNTQPECVMWAEERWTQGIEKSARSYFEKLAREGGGNRSFWADPELDCWLDLARRKPDLEWRKKLYSLVQARLAADLPVLFLWHEDNIAATTAHLNNVSLSFRPDLSFVSKLRRSTTP